MSATSVMKASGTCSRGFEIISVGEFSDIVTDAMQQLIVRGSKDYESSPVEEGQTPVFLSAKLQKPHRETSV